MKIRYAKRFVKQLGKLKSAERSRFYERQKLFEENPSHEILGMHALKGRYKGYFSLNVGGDLRALFVKKGDELIIFELIGTHSQLYGK